MAEPLGPIGFVGGVNNKATTNTIGKDQMSDAQNVYLVSKDLVKLFGSRTLNSSVISGSPAVTGVIDWQTAAGQRYQVITAGTKIFQTADLGTTFTDITGAVTITSGQNNQSTFASLNNLIVRCGGGDAPIKWSGSGNAAALGGSPPSGKIVHTVNNFMFISGIATDPSKVQWSNVSDPETWGSSNYIYYRKSDGDVVTALSHIDQNLIIFKRGAIGKLDTTTNIVAGSSSLGALYDSINGTGCVGPNALDTLPDGRIVFMSPNAHIYLYDGSMLEDISDPEPPRSNIQNWLDGLVRLQYIVIRFYPTRNQIWVTGSESGQNTNNIAFIYDTAKNVWTCKVTGRSINAMCTAIDTRTAINHNVVLLTGNYGGRVFEQDSGNSNAEDTNGVIDGYGTTAVQLSGDATTFTPRSALVPLEYQGASSLEFNYGFNDFSNVNKSTLLSQNIAGAIGLDSFVLDTNTLAEGKPLRRMALLYSTGKTASVQVQFRNRNSNEPFTVHPYWISDEVVD